MPHRQGWSWRPGKLTRRGRALCKLFGNGPHLWLRLRATYDAWRSACMVDISKIPSLGPMVPPLSDLVVNGLEGPVIALGRRACGERDDEVHLSVEDDEIARAAARR